MMLKREFKTAIFINKTSFKKKKKPTDFVILCSAARLTVSKAAVQTVSPSEQNTRIVYLYICVQAFFHSKKITL